MLYTGRCGPMYAALCDGYGAYFWKRWCGQVGHRDVPRRGPFLHTNLAPSGHSRKSWRGDSLMCGGGLWSMHGVWE